MLKHLTLSSGCMQKQQWMLHLYWIEVIRRHFLSLHFPSPPPPNRFSPESLVRSPGLRSAEAHRAEAAGWSVVSPFSHTVPLVFLLFSGVEIEGGGGRQHPPPPPPSPLVPPKNCAGKQCKQKEETKTPEEEEEEENTISFTIQRGPFRRKTRVSFPRRCKPQRQASPFTRCLFPPHRDAHSPPPTTSVTTATTITTTAISPPTPTLPSPHPSPLPDKTGRCALLAHVAFNK